MVSENSGFSFMDSLVILKKWRIHLLGLSIFIFVLSYTCIYFFVDEEFESSGLIVSSGETSSGLFSGLMKNLKDIPLSLGSKSKSADTDLFLTLVNSRKLVEELVRKFGLQADYKEKSWDKTIKKAKEKIKAELDDQNALVISFRANSPKKAAQIVNYIINFIDINSNEISGKKNRTNRAFLEKRYNEVKDKLRESEESLQKFQKEAGLYDIKDQIRMIMTSNIKFETDYLAKKLEYDLLKTSLPEDSPVLNTLSKQLNTYKTEIDKIKEKSSDESVFLKYSSLPEKAKNYVRAFRNVEIYSSLLEFVIPLYEQAKLEEERTVAVLNIIDYGNVPEKRVFPQRTLLSGVITFMLLSISLFIILSHLYLRNSSNLKLKKLLGYSI